MPAQTPLAYIRQQVTMAGENFILAWKSLNDKDKADMTEWAKAALAEAK